MTGSITQAGFAVLYRWTIAAGHEETVIARWRAATIALREGGPGSCLTREANGRACRILRCSRTKLTTEGDMPV